jgi:dTDP-4-dehydrorhamnose reductase
MAGPFLLIGGDSEIATATAAQLRQQGAAVIATTRRRQLVAEDRPFLDLTQPLEDWRPPAGARAAAIFAAIARIPDCARDPQASAFVNVTQTVALAERLLAAGIPVLFLSTDKVFDGSRPAMPADAPLSPLTEYGRQKAAAETALRALMEAGAPVTILRFAKILSPGMPLLRDWKQALLAGQPVRGFADLVTAPTPVALAAAAVAALLERSRPGIFQLSGPRDVSYAEIAFRLAHRVGAPPELVEPRSAYDAGMPPGSTPAHTTLDSRAICGLLGQTVPDAWPVIDAVIDSL